MRTISDCGHIWRKWSFPTRRASMKRRVRSSTCISPSREVPPLADPCGLSDGLGRRGRHHRRQGARGIAGLPRRPRFATSSVYVQVPGHEGSRWMRAQFRSELDRGATLNLVMLRYVFAFFNQVAQSAACARTFTGWSGAFFAGSRWPARPQMPTGDFLLTQEFLGMMLGVHQDVPVTDVGWILQKAGLIFYFVAATSRSSITRPCSSRPANATRFLETGVRAAAR